MRDGASDLHRPVRMRALFRRAAFAALGIAVSAPAVAAQIIRGRVLLPDSTPAAGIVISAMGTGDVEAARALSTSTGEYTLRLRAAGTYDVRALRIGFRPTTVRTVALGAGATVVQDIVLVSLPVSIAAMQVRDDDDCSLKGRDAATFLQLWEQARGALTAAQVSESSGALDVRVIRVEGHIDAYNSFADSLYPVVDTANAREMIVDRVFAATSPDTIAARGYVRARDDGRAVYDMPNAQTLLSDAFVGGHCFAVKKSKDHGDWIGLGFTPRRKVDRIVDIRGVLWLDRASAELRRVDFEYANLPDTAYEVCDRAPHVPITPEMLSHVPPFTQPSPGCSRVKDGGSNRLQLGGYADFVRLATGEWLVSEWMLRTGPDEGRYRKLPWRVRRVKNRSERCYSGPDCRTIISMFPRLVTSKGTVASVVRDGVRVYHNEDASTVIAAMSAKRAGDSPAGLAGAITNEDGKLLAGAILQLEDPWRAVHTDSSGAFRFDGLPPQMINVTVRCRGYQPVRGRVPLLGDSTRRLTVSLVREDSAASAKNC